MTWPGDREHATLVQSANVLLGNLAALPTRFVIGDVQYYMHTEFAQRTTLLGHQLRAAIALVREDLYLAAFALLRTCLEQVCVDRLMFLGRTFHQRFRNVSEERWKQWQGAREAGVEWTRDIVDWQRSKNGRVRIVREGLRSEGDEGQTLSIFYFLLDRYRPWIGPPSAQELVEDGLIDLDTRRKQAEENRDIYTHYLSWPSIKTNLQENQLATNTEVNQLDVHYRFLSGFVHPIAHVTDAVYGRNRQWPAYDHFASELALLYVIAFSVAELRAFKRRAQQPPLLTLSGWEEVEADIAAAEAAAAHLWFLVGKPHEYDRCRVANQRGFAARLAGEPVAPLSDVSDADISYYANPLERLVAMHSSSNELMTGFLYVSPWERPDARWR